MTKNWFNSKWFVRAISLAFAVLLYIFVNIEAGNSQNEASIFFPNENDEVQTVEEVPVEIRIDSEKYVVSGVPEYVSVTLEGIASSLTRTAMQKNFILYGDLEILGVGEDTVDSGHDHVPKELSI